MPIASFGPMERLVSPFVPPRVLALDRTPPTPVGVTTDGIVHARWGGEGGTIFTAEESGSGFHIVLAPGKGTPYHGEDGTGGNLIVFEDVGRETEDIRVENPDDPLQYVIVQRIVNAYFRPPPQLQRPVDEYWQLAFHHPPPKPTEGD